MQAAAEAQDQNRINQSSQQTGVTGKSEYLSSMIYGGLDGTVTTFAIVSGVIGAQLSPGIVLILGLANLLGDGFSMASGAYLSAKSDQEIYERERQHTAEQVAHHPEGEREALFQAYRAQGFPQEDTLKLVEIKSRDPGRWVSTMMIERLMLLPQKRKPFREALATFGAFVIVGTVPLLTYLADLVFPFELPSPVAFGVSAVLSALALFGLGAAKVFVTQRNPLRSGLEMLGVGGAAAAVAFAIGALLKGIVP